MNTSSRAKHYAKIIAHQHDKIALQGAAVHIWRSQWCMPKMSTKTKSTHILRKTDVEVDQRFFQLVLIEKTIAIEVALAQLSPDAGENSNSALCYLLANVLCGSHTVKCHVSTRRGNTVQTNFWVKCGNPLKKSHANVIHFGW